MSRGPNGCDGHRLCAFPTTDFFRMRPGSRVTYAFCQGHSPRNTHDTHDWERISEEEFLVSQVLET